MRTRYLTVDHFDQVLARLQQAYQTEKTAYEQLIAGQELTVPISEFVLSTNLVAQVRARYSRGDELADIAGLYPEIADRFIKSWDPGDVVYTQLFDVLTLGVLLDAPAETFARIGQLVDKAKLRDYLADYFLAWRQPRPLHPRLKWQTNRTYNGLRQLTESPPADAPARLREYLEQDWYRKSNTDISYNAHLRDEHLFNGYWSFGAGAVAKIMGLNDAGLADSEYYPYDLVHRAA